MVLKNDCDIQQKLEIVKIDVEAIDEYSTSERSDLW